MLATPSFMPLLLLLIPLAGFLVNGLLYPLFVRGVEKTNNMIAGTLASLAMFAAFVVACLSFRELQGNASALESQVYQWVQWTDWSLALNLRIDALSSLMTLVITGVGTLIHIYSIGYMAHEEGAARFFAYLNLFCTAMLLLVLSDNLLFLFFGWEGVGLCSYLLISYWYGEKANADAARKAFLVNRVGDFAFVVAMCMLLAKFGTLQFVELLRLSSSVDSGFVFAIAALLFFAATGKSAQIPLYVWLPDAMAGPTPVSALIHAATMVTAGVYLFARLSGLMELAPMLMQLVSYVGLATALLGGFIALAQSDIKKVLAYSTVSQLGLMFLALGLGAYQTAVFHLMTHAFFKALLFLGAGSVIHACEGEQDLNKMGGLRAHLPITHATMLIGSLAIMGFPFFSGFFSKDEILFAAGASSRGGVLVFSLALLAALLTAVYMVRLLALAFWGKARAGIKGHESPAIMLLPLIVLAVLASFGGILGMPESWSKALGFSGHLLEHWLSPVVFTGAIDHHAALVSHGMVSVLAVGLSLLGGAYAFMRFRSQSELPISGLHRLFAAKFYIDEAYGFLLVRPLQFLSQACARILEQGFLMRLGQWLGWGTSWSGDRLRVLQSGDLQVLGLIVLSGSALILAISLMWTRL